MIVIDNLLDYQLTGLEWILCHDLWHSDWHVKNRPLRAGLFVVPVFANIFGGKPSTGLVLPMLIVADIFAVLYYNRHANWKYVLKLLPWAFGGILLAMFVGKAINDQQFRHLIAFIVIIGILWMVYQDISSKHSHVPDYPWFAALLGTSGGFSTMIGNAAGPIMSLYLLSMRLPKNIYIGTGAWFFFIINLSKVPLHIFVWKTITQAEPYLRPFHGGSHHCRCDRRILSCEAYSRQSLPYFYHPVYHGIIYRTVLKACYGKISPVSYRLNYFRLY